MSIFLFFFFFQKREKKFRNFFFFPYFRSLIHIFPTPRTRSNEISKGSSNNTPYPLPLPDSLIIFRILFFEPRHSANFPREKVLPKIFQNFTSFRESFYFRIFEKQPPRVRKTGRKIFNETNLVFETIFSFHRFILLSIFVK